MGSLTNTFRVLTAHGLDSTVGFNVKTTTEWVKTNPAGNLSYTIALSGFEGECTVKARTPFTPDTAGDLVGTISATLLEMDSNSQATFSLIQMRAGDYSADQAHSELGTYSQVYHYDNQGADNIDFITVSA